MHKKSFNLTVLVLSFKLSILYDHQLKISQYEHIIQKIDKLLWLRQIKKFKTQSLPHP